MKHIFIVFLFFIGILFLAAFFRLTGVNWDQNQHLHPDERFLTMVANGLAWPKNINEYLNTDTSPMNPHNRGNGFFVYGLFPVTLTKWVAEGIGKGDYGNLTLVGRQLSAIVDLGTVVLVFLISKQLIRSIKNKPTTDNRKLTTMFPLLAMFFYAISVLPIQLSHFYAVDTYLVFFSTIAFYLLCRLVNLIKQKTLPSVRSYILAIGIGICIGLAMASKISGILIFPTVGIALFVCFLMKKKIVPGIVFIILLSFSLYLTFRLAHPYAFSTPSLFTASINPKFISNMKELKNMDNDKSMFPPAIQWRNRTPFLFPLQSMILHGFGIPLSVITLGGFIVIFFLLIAQCNKNLKRLFQTKHIPQLTPSTTILALLLIFPLTVFLYQGSLYTKNMRYFASMYPALCVLGGYVVGMLIQIIFQKKSRAMFMLTTILVIFLPSVWPISFLAIYERPHSRNTASQWIYENIPAGEVLGYEHWDDPLPLYLPDLSPETYKYLEMPLYPPDVVEKWTKIAENLEKVDYLVLSSNRLWGSISRVPSIYPIASRYYQNLFDGTLGFEKVIDIRSIPCFPSSSFCLFPIDDTKAEESFTVYDHPQILIYKKTNLNKVLVRTWVEESKNNRL